MRVEILGTVAAWRGPTPLDVGPVRRQAVLAALVLAGGTPVSHEQLLDRVWGTEPPNSGRRVLPSYVYPLRKALDPEGAGPAGSVIRGSGGGYRFALDDVLLDTAELDYHADSARRARAAGDLTTALARFTAACALFRGEPLAGLPGPFALGERQRLSDRRRMLRAETAECLVLLGRHGDALDDLTALTASDPLDESLVALRMRALYGVERQGEALKAYASVCARLRDELGVDPGEELRRVHEAVLRRDDVRLLGRPPERPAAPPTARPVPPPPARSRRAVNDLPGVTGRLSGRARELGLLTAPPPPDAVSIATVDGPAGVGKTTLVVHAAQRLHTSHPDGCLYVDLRAHSTSRRSLTPQRVLRRLLRSLGAPDSEVPNDLDELTAAWRSATSSLRLLLVLDDAVSARDVAPLLPAGPGSRVLVTSRQRLVELDVDRRVSLEPLGTDDAVSLLRQLAGAARADKEPEATRELTRLCDGLPLALQIAGVRLQTRPAWTLAHLVERMTGDEGRLGELNAGERSVEAAFTLSYDQLPQRLRRGFRALGLAPTVEVDPLTVAAMLGCSPADAEEALESLVDTSLLHQTRPGRYRLHDLVRVHARRLARTAPTEAATARTAALGLYLDAGRLASDWGPSGFPTGPRSLGSPFTDWREAENWLDTVGGELPDVVVQAAALGEPDHACWIAEALCDYFLRRGRYHECRVALEAALSCADRATERRMDPALRNGMGMVDSYQGRYAEGHAWFTEALRVSRANGDRREEARALAGLGAVNLNTGRGDEAMAQLTTSVDSSEKIGDRWLASTALSFLGTANQLRGNPDAALDCFRRSYSHVESEGRPHTLSRTLACIADVHIDLGNHGEAGELLHRASALAGQSGSPLLYALTLTRLGTAEAAAGDTTGAISRYRDALSQHGLLDPLAEPHYNWAEMHIRCRLGETYAEAGHPYEACEQFRTALAVPDSRTHAEEYARATEGLKSCTAD
ncbi:BTAD domain-containing putative transcriptional regulator [Streptomyces sp. Cmuel-A718b]|uniref:AfsR/SARP family transcriptional regulator n=1 Tax=Streptomyces sp. Cmuel-A718b TaxID=697328 RepID=UPI00081E8ADB|nr:BTAD domain-containing putative transcriptional regulator [Streptomyces sp. Cmuel-A718b]SCF88207.1 DNA-binding transcriptional activator of the SARP family [Streptomyces sp. Cmuel-A718b]